MSFVLLMGLQLQLIFIHAKCIHMPNKNVQCIHMPNKNVQCIHMPNKNVQCIHMPNKNVHIQFFMIFSVNYSVCITYTVYELYKMYTKLYKILCMNYTKCITWPVNDVLCALCSIQYTVHIIRYRLYPYIYRRPIRR